MLIFEIQGKKGFSGVVKIQIDDEGVIQGSVHTKFDPKVKEFSGTTKNLPGMFEWFLENMQSDEFSANQSYHAVKRLVDKMMDDVIFYANRKGSEIYTKQRKDILIKENTNMEKRIGTLADFINESIELGKHIVFDYEKERYIKENYPKLIQLLRKIIGKDFVLVQDSTTHYIGDIIESPVEYGTEGDFVYTEEGGKKVSVLPYFWGKSPIYAAVVIKDEFYGFAVPTKNLKATYKVQILRDITNFEN